MAPLGSPSDNRATWQLAHCVASVKLAVTQQWAFACMLARDQKFRGPMICLWLEDFGASLHMPVITFFFLGLGATPMDIGVFGFCRALGVLLLSPIYGRAVDRHGIMYPLLVCTSLCGFGCLVRGSSNTLWQLYAAAVITGMGGGSSWSMTKGHIARHSDEDQRPMIVAGLRMQMTLISFSRVLYPALDAILSALFELEEELPRYRAAVMTCMSFCWIGIAAIATCRPPQADLTSVHDGEVLGESEITPSKPNAGILGSSFRCKFQHVLLGAAIAAAACSFTACSTLWAIFLKARFHFGAKQFAVVSSAETLAITAALAGYPRAVALQGGGRDGGIRVAEWLACCACCLVLSAYCLSPMSYNVSHSVGVVMHVLLALAASACLGALSPCLETVASLYVPTEAQGVAMGALNAAYSLGGLVGPLAGTALWTASVKDTAWFFGANGRLPYLAVSCLLGAIAVSLRFCLPESRGETPQMGSDGGLPVAQKIGLDHDTSSDKVDDSGRLRQDAGSEDAVLLREWAAVGSSIQVPDPEHSHAQ